MSAPIRLTKDQLFRQYCNCNHIKAENEAHARAAFEHIYRANQEIKRGAKGTEAEEKICKSCGESLLLSLFQDNKLLKGGKFHTCKNCRNEKSREAYTQKRLERERLEQEKEDDRKALGQEIKRLLESGVRQKEIAAKLELNSSVYYEAIKDLKIDKVKFFKNQKEKACSVCKKVKKLEEYHNLKQTRDGKTARCRACASEAKKAKRRLNK